MNLKVKYFSLVLVLICSLSCSTKYQILPPQDKKLPDCEVNERGFLPSNGLHLDQVGYGTLTRTISRNHNFNIEIAPNTSFDSLSTLTLKRLYPNNTIDTVMVTIHTDNHGCRSPNVQSKYIPILVALDSLQRPLLKRKDVYVRPCPPMCVGGIIPN